MMKPMRLAVFGTLLLGATIARALPLPDETSSENLTLDEVQRAGHEVTYEEVANLYGGPMSKHPLFSLKAHPELLWVRPDMGIGMVANPFAFGVGEPLRAIPWRTVRRSLMKGYLPVIISRWADGPLLYEQLAFAVLLEGREVRTGHEKQVAMVRMSVENTDASANEHAVFWAFIPADVYMKGGLLKPVLPDGTYALFDVTGSLPPAPQTLTAPTDDIVRDGPVLLGSHSEDRGVRAKSSDKVLKFEMDLRPGEKRSVYLKISSNKKGLSPDEIERLRQMDFLSALDRKVIDLEAITNRGTKIRVPEDIVNNIYKAQILYNQTDMVQAADRNYYMPVQGYHGGWPWEEAKMLVPLDAFGYHEDVRKSLEFFLKLQGRYPPNGQVKSYEGVFTRPGTFDESGWENDSESTIYGMLHKQRVGKKWMSWMNGTGGVLYAFGEHYFYSKDRQWLEGVAPALIKACDWIIHERQQTKQMDAQGRKVIQYGLLPAGEAYDPHPTEPTKFDYTFCFTDGYTYQGLKRVAEALEDIRHPEAQRLLREAASYRDDILEVMRRTRRTDPKLPPFPERLYQPDGWAAFATGPLALVDTGLLDPHDPAFVQMENYTKAHFSVLGLTGRAYVDPVIQPSYYVVISEDIYHRAWILRGDIEKALLTFYSTLAFGVDKDTLGSVERFALYDRRYAPFYMDGSGSSRICAMIRRSLLLEEGSVLHLLAGAPRRWLEDGKKIEVREGVTYFGKMDLKVQSQVDRQEILADVVLRIDRPERLRAVRLRLPHPAKLRMTQVTVNGKTWRNFNPDQEVIELPPTESRYHIVAHY